MTLASRSTIYQSQKPLIAHLKRIWQHGILNLYIKQPDIKVTCATFIYGHAEPGVTATVKANAMCVYSEFAHTSLKLKLSHFSFKLKLVSNTISMETLEEV